MDYKIRNVLYDFIVPDKVTWSGYVCFGCRPQIIGLWDKATLRPTTCSFFTSS